MAGNTKVVCVGPFSDGDPNHVPKSEWTMVPHPTIYLEKLATQWMMARGENRYGVNYRLDRLPEGYRLYERPRPQNPKLIDKHLYGHPQHKFFDSPNRFYKHFEWLMNNKPEEKCLCTLCGKGAPLSTNPKPPGSKIIPSNTNALALAKNPRFVDEERTPDIFRRFIDKLRKLSTLDQDLNENMSMDWRAERSELPRMLETLPLQRSWIPRVGELVLFVRDLTGEICYDGNTKGYRVFNEKEQQFVGPPKWEAGVIGQIPVESVHIQDVLQEVPKTQSVTYTGFRVEPFPDPNGKDKRYTKQYKYVPLHQTRPFVFWQDMLRGTPESDWHPTITNALTIMSSLSLVEKYRFQGKWPVANVLCKGIFVGAELVCVGDAVRILPDPKADKVTDVLHVHSIKLKVTNLDKASDDDNDEGHPYNSTVYLAGRAYTTSRARAWDETSLARTQDLPSSMHGYQEWFHLHDPEKQYIISFTKVLGRCHEAETMQLCFPSNDEDVSQYSHLSRGLSGLRLARSFSSQSDQRVKDGKQWYWGDCRCEVLDIETLNSVEVSVHNQGRDDDLLVGWRAVIRVLDKTADQEAIRQTSLVERAPPVAMLSSMGQAAFDEDEVIPSVENPDDNGSNNEGDDEATGDDDEDQTTETELLRRFQIPKKRSRSVAEGDSSRSDSSGGAFHNVDRTMPLPSMPKPMVIVPAYQPQGQQEAMHDSKKAKVGWVRGK